MSIVKNKTLRNENYGSPISLRLSQHLKEYTNKDDRANASTSKSVGILTIDRVVGRSNNLTKENEGAIVHLLELSIQKCIDRPIKDKEALKTLKSMITK